MSTYRHVVWFALGACAALMLIQPFSAYTDRTPKPTLENRVIALEKRVDAIEGKPAAIQTAPTVSDIRSVGDFVQKVPKDLCPPTGHTFWPQLNQAAVTQWGMKELKGKTATFRLKMESSKAVGKNIEVSFGLQTPFKYHNLYIYTFWVRGQFSNDKMKQLLKLKPGSLYTFRGKLKDFKAIPTTKYRSVVGAKIRKGFVPTTYTLILENCELVG